MERASPREPASRRVPCPPVCGRPSFPFAPPLTHTLSPSVHARFLCEAGFSFPAPSPHRAGVGRQPCHREKHSWADGHFTRFAHKDKGFFGQWKWMDVFSVGLFVVFHIKRLKKHCFPRIASPTDAAMIPLTHSSPPYAACLHSGFSP